MHDTTPNLTAAETVSADEVLRAHFTLTSIEGALECIQLDGAEGWTSPNPHPALSLFRFNSLDPTRVGEALDTVLARFVKEGRPVEWMTGPNCVAAGFDSLLTSRGFDPQPMQVAAMSMNLRHEESFVPTAGAKASLVGEADAIDLGRVMAKGFSVPDEVGEIYHQAYLTATDLQRSEVYGAWVDGIDEPVGAGYLTYLDNGKNALLRASSVLENARGKGAYRALVERRVADAAARGCREMFVHAYSKGSRECLSNIGFRTLGGLSLYHWSPQA